MMASICMVRNYKCIKVLVDIYTIDMVIDCTLDESLKEALRARFARLLITLHLDKDPLEALNVPVMTRVWDDIDNDQFELPRSTNIPPRLLKLKPAFEKIVRDTLGQCRVFKEDFNIFLLEVLKIIETMLGLGFYEDEEEMKNIMEPLILLLDGHLDFYKEEEEIQHKKQIEESGSGAAYQPLIKTKDQHKMRYNKTIENDGIMKIKNKIIDICVKIMDILDNKRLSNFLYSFAQFDKNLQPKI